MEYKANKGVVREGKVEEEKGKEGEVKDEDGGERERALRKKDRKRKGI